MTDNQEISEQCPMTLSQLTIIDKLEIVALLTYYWFAIFIK